MISGILTHADSSDDWSRDDWQSHTTSDSEIPSMMGRFLALVVRVDLWQTAAVLLALSQMGFYLLKSKISSFGILKLQNLNQVFETEQNVFCSMEID